MANFNDRLTARQRLSLTAVAAMMAVGIAAVVLQHESLVVRIVLTPVAAVFAIETGVLLWASVPPRSGRGQDDLIGRSGVVVRSLDPQGRVRVAGALWAARSATEETLTVGTDIEVARREGLELVVEAAGSEHG